MNKRRILLKLILDDISLGELSLDKFSQRLELQKKIYLIQLTSMNLGYRYNWYLRGPYAPSVTEDAFLLKEDIKSNEEDYKEYHLSDSAKEKVEKAKQIWALESEESIGAVEWVELLASLHYLKHIAYWPIKPVTKEHIFDKIEKTKPAFEGRHDLMQKAWDRLNCVGLIKNKTVS